MVFYSFFRLFNFFENWPARAGDPLLWKTWRAPFGVSAFTPNTNHAGGPIKWELRNLPVEEALVPFVHSPGILI